MTAASAVAFVGWILTALIPAAMRLAVGLEVSEFLPQQLESRSVLESFLWTSTKFGYSLLFALPAIALGLVFGSRRPVLARLLSTAGFLVFAGWLQGDVQSVMLVIPGWVFAVVMFPWYSPRLASPSDLSINRCTEDDAPAPPRFLPIASEVVQ